MLTLTKEGRCSIKHSFKRTQASVTRSVLKMGSSTNFITSCKGAEITAIEIKSG